MKQINIILLLKQIENYHEDEYKSYLWFNIDGHNFGDKIIITFKLIEKIVQKNGIEENMDTIKKFKNKFGLIENLFSNETILEHLKINNFDFNQAFDSLYD